MARRGRWWGRAAALLALACVGSVGSTASIPSTEAWSANPDDQFLLEVRLHQFRIGEGVRAYQTPTGTCIMLGDFLTTLDVPMRVDLAKKAASGWAFKEDHRIAIDLAGERATYGEKSEDIVPGTVRETPGGWCVDSAALTRWFGIAVKPMTSGSVLVIESEAKLPVELAMERQLRAAQIKPAKFDLATLPQVRLPYRMWRAPALDFVVSAGATYSADTGVRVDRQASVYAAGEIARLSYDAHLSTDQRGMPNSLRMRAYRSDPDGGLLGPLKATHFGFGDVAGLDSRLTGSSVTGRGAVVTNRPLFNPTAFDRTRFEGDLPPGWEAELYRNGELLAFAKATAGNRYAFEDVALLYGENQISIVLYGPQGQIRTREEVINVGQDNVPAGQTWYWAGVNQPGRDLVSFGNEARDVTQPKAEGAISVEHGLDGRTSVGVLARMMLVGDERLTFVEGSVRRSVGSALVEVAAARDSNGGTAARAQMLGKFGQVNVSAEALIAKDFFLQGTRETSRKDFKLALDAPVRIGRTVIPTHADVRMTELADGTRQLEAAARLAANIDRFNLSAHLSYQKQYLRHGPDPPPQLLAGLLGTGRIGDVRVRGSIAMEAAPRARFRTAELSAYWSASDHADWEGALAYDAQSRRARARVTHIRRFNTMAVALTGEAATDGSLAAGINLNFSLDARDGFELSRQPLAAAGVVHARVYRDLNDNGVHDAAEPFEKNALVTTGNKLSEKATDSRGSVLIGGLSTFVPVTVGIDESSLSDPMLVPRKALQVVVPRPGIPADVEIGLVGGGDVEGAIVKSGGIGFEGLDLELVDARGEVVATTRSDFDGFFLFERVPYGSYRIRVAKASAEAAHVPAAIDAVATVTPEVSVVRMGQIEVAPVPQIASAD
jgi:hypothetical protein